MSVIGAAAPPVAKQSLPQKGNSASVKVVGSWVFFVQRGPNGIRGKHTLVNDYQAKGIGRRAVSVSRNWSASFQGVADAVIRLFSDLIHSLLGRYLTEEHCSTIWY